MKTWLDPEEIEIPPDLLSVVGGNPLLAYALIHRGIRDSQQALSFLDPDRYIPSPPKELPGMEKAVLRIVTALQAGERILVWGDFDVDGQTATALLVQTLEDLGGKVSYHVPVRASESHGVSVPVLSRLLQETPRTSLLLTCDTGIAAFEAVEHASSLGVDVIITDHHALPCSLHTTSFEDHQAIPRLEKQAATSSPSGLQNRLPTAIAILTPRFLPDHHPLSSLPGVGVAYKLAEALYAWAGRHTEIEKHLDLAALGIVADVASLTGESRYLVQRGLMHLRSTRRIGLKAIYQWAGVVVTRLNEEQIGFTLAPRLNALGRLADANLAVELLTTSDEMRARDLAIELERLNSQRQLLCAQVQREALTQLAHDPEQSKATVLVLHNPAWHQGVIGIVASRLVELYGKPALLFAGGQQAGRQSIQPDNQSGDVEPARGSARSIPGVDITAAIASQSGLLLGYGGHSMAAGLTIPVENIAAFRRGLDRYIRKVLPDMTVKQMLPIDGILDWDALNMQLASEIERLAPFGQGNRPLTLATHDLRVLDKAPFGREKVHLNLLIEDRLGVTRRVIWWNGSDVSLPEDMLEGRIDLAYQLRASTYHGKPDLSIEVLDIRPREMKTVETGLLPLQVTDLRSQTHPMFTLQQLLASEQPTFIWAEAGAVQKLQQALANIKITVGQRGVRLGTRLEMDACHTLLVWTSPASLDILQAGLDRVKPAHVVLFAVDPGLYVLKAFLERLAGLVKNVIFKQAGQVELKRLAGGMAARYSAVRLGLEWLSASGYIKLDKAEENGWLDEVVHLHPGDGRADIAGSEQAQANLRLVLDETRAFRQYYRSIDAERLLTD